MIHDHNTYSSIPDSSNSTPSCPFLLATPFFIFFPASSECDVQPFDGYSYQNSQPSYSLKLLPIHSAKMQLRVRQPICSLYYCSSFAKHCWRNCITADSCHGKSAVPKLTLTFNTTWQSFCSCLVVVLCHQ